MVIMTDRQQKNMDNEAEQENDLNNESDSSVDIDSAVEQGEDIAQLKKEHEEQVSALNNKLLRLAAELENLGKRNEQQTSDLKKYAISGFAKEIITVLENFYLILDNAPREIIEKDENLNNFYKGIEITHKDLTKVFEKNGITRIYPLGEKFDHNLHQVVKQVESDKESGTIIQVMQAGYILNDRLLKEAMVVISK